VSHLVFALWVLSNPPAAEPTVVTEAASVPAPSAPRDLVQILLTPDGGPYPMGVTYGHQTTISTPIDCGAPTLGDDDAFAVFANAKNQRRFILAVQSNQPGAATLLTLRCAEGLQLALALRQVPVTEAALKVDLVLAPATLAQLRDERAATVCADKLTAQGAKLRHTAQEAMVAQMLAGVRTNDDVEYARRKFVVVKVYQQVVLGARGYLLFHVQNRSEGAVEVEAIDLTTADAPCANVSLVMPARVVEAGATERGAVVFDVPATRVSLTLVVGLAGPLQIKIEDIDL